MADSVEPPPLFEYVDIKNEDDDDLFASAVQKKRKSLSIQQKIDIINKLDTGVKNHVLSTEYNVSQSTIATIKSNREKIIERYKELTVVNVNPTKKKRIVHPENDVLEKVVLSWLQQSRMTGQPVSGKLVKEKARKFHMELKKQGKVPWNHEFKGSSGWLANFKERNGLKSLQLKEEMSCTGSDTSKRFVKNFTKLLNENNYILDDVYNAEETGLLYRSLPNRTLGNETNMPGFKKERLTVMVSSNASGSHRIPLLIIGKSANPQCFQNNQPHLEYSNQKNACMNKAIFLYWFQNVFLKTVRMSKPNARTILLLNNATSHLVDDQLNEIDDNCRIVYVPPSVSSLILPMNQGIILALKRQYKKEFLRDILSRNHLTNSACIQHVKKWSVLDCMNVLREAWGSLTPDTLRNSWKKILPSLAVSNKVKNSNLSSNNELVALLNCIPGCATVTSLDVMKWLLEENELPVFEVLSESELLNVHGGLRLPIKEEKDDEDEDGTFKETSELKGVESPSCEVVMEMAQFMVDWTRSRTEFSEEERLTFIKARDLALNSFLALKDTKNK